MSLAGRLTHGKSTTEDLQATTPTTPLVSRAPEAYKVRDRRRSGRSPTRRASPSGSRSGACRRARSSTTSISRRSPTPTRATSAHRQDELEIVIPAGSVDRLRGARLEWSEDDGGGLVLVNPNSPTPEEVAPDVPPELLAQGITGPLALRVVAVLEQVGQPLHRQPRRARRPGRAERRGRHGVPPSLGRLPGLRHVADDAAPGDRDDAARRGPRADRILDVTDHGGGENPFYTLSRHHSLTLVTAVIGLTGAPSGRPVALRRAALPDRRRVPRAGPRRHRRGAARRAARRGVRRRRRAGPPPPRLRARPADALRGRRDHPARRHPPRPHARLAGRHRDRQHRVAEVDRGDVARARARRARCSPSPGPGTPTCPGC